MSSGVGVTCDGAKRRAKRVGIMGEARSEERSDELKVFSYVGRRYNAFAVASL